MREEDLRALLIQLQNGDLNADTVFQKLISGPFRSGDLGHSMLDMHRSLRQGLCEVVYGESKTAEQVLDIAERLSETGEPILITRLDDAKRTLLKDRFADGHANDLGRTFMLNPSERLTASDDSSYVTIVCAGTSDLPVVEEAAETCLAARVAFEIVSDVGVAGLHRLLQRMEVLQKAAAVVVVAGMEGALASVVGGLIGKPIIAVPTSVGYGANFQGLAALLAMLNSCASGVTVVNIDNGFSAAVAACKIVREVKRAVQKQS